MVLVYTGIIHFNLLRTYTYGTFHYNGSFIVYDKQANLTL